VRTGDRHPARGAAFDIRQVRPRSAGRDAGIKGTGIGLTLARHIVDAHRGEIRLESLAGQGSTFTILLPLEDAG